MSWEKSTKELKETYDLSLKQLKNCKTMSVDSTTIYNMKLLHKRSRDRYYKRLNLIKRRAKVRTYQR